MAGIREKRLKNMKAGGLFYSDAMLKLPKPTKRQKEMARKVLGDEDFPYFDALRCGNAEDRARARNVLMGRHQGIIGIVVHSNKWQRFVIERFDGSVDFEDLWSVGSLGLAHALEAFDYTRGFRFSSYAVSAIDSKLSRTFMLSRDSVRIPAHVNDDMRKVHKFRGRFLRERGHNPSEEEIISHLTDLGMSDLRARRTLEALRRFMPSNPTHALARKSSYGESRQDVEAWEVVGIAEGFENTNDNEQTLKEIQATRMVGFLLDRTPLDEREAKILCWRFGLGGLHEMTLAEIGKKLGISRERVRQLEARAMHKLRKVSEDLTVTEIGDL